MRMLFLIMIIAWSGHIVNNILALDDINVAHPMLYPVKNFWKENLYGYMNIFGDLVIQYQFDYAENFSEGLACVVHSDTPAYLGYIDHKGKYMIAPRLHYSPEINGLHSFSEGLAPFYIKTKSDTIPIEEVLWGYIDKSGTVIIEPQFSSAQLFKNDKAYVTQRFKYHKKSDLGILSRIGRSGRLMSKEDMEKHLYSYPKPESYYISKNGQRIYSGNNGMEDVEIINSTYKLGRHYLTPYISFTLDSKYSGAPFSHGLACIRDNDTEYYGYINEKGEMVCPPCLKSAKPFDGHLAEVSLMPQMKAYLNKKGKLVCPDDVRDTFLAFNISCCDMMKNINVFSTKKFEKQTNSKFEICKTQYWRWVSPDRRDSVQHIIDGLNAKNKKSKSYK